MIPSFPKFKKLEVTDKPYIENVTNRLPPYSDYNFVSLWSWDTDGSIEISSLNDNLIIKMPDYVTNEIFYSFIGTNEVDATIKMLIEHARQHGINPLLKLIPESVVKLIKNPEQFVVEEDRDGFDYVIDIVDFINTEGTKNRTKRNELNKYTKSHGHLSQIVPIDLMDTETKKKVFGVFFTWEKARGKNREETQNELTAIKRLIDHAQHFNLQALGLLVDGEMKGFSIYEVLQDSHGIGHFEKGDTSYRGIMQYLKHHAAKNLLKHEVKYFNEEQDLGIEGLRTSKLLHHPSHFLRKYSISLK